MSPTLENPHLELVQRLVPDANASAAKNFYCPSLTSATMTFTPQNFRAGNIGYYYYCAESASENPDLSKFLRTGMDWPRKLNISMPPETWVMSDVWFSGVPTSHAGYRKGLNYLMLDGSVGFVSESPRQAFH